MRQRAAARHAAQPLRLSSAPRLADPRAAASRALPPAAQHDGPVLHSLPHGPPRPPVLQPSLQRRPRPRAGRQVSPAAQQAAAASQATAQALAGSRRCRPSASVWHPCELPPPPTPPPAHAQRRGGRPRSAYPVRPPRGLARGGARAAQRRQRRPAAARVRQVIRGRRAGLAAVCSAGGGAAGRPAVERELGQVRRQRLRACAGLVRHRPAPRRARAMVAVPS